MLSEYQHEKVFIGGGWVVPRSREKITVFSPATEEPIGYVPNCSVVDVDLAVAKARSAFRHSGWKALAMKERAKLLRKAAKILRSKISLLQRIAAHESGLPIGFVYGDGSNFSEQSAKLLDYYASLGERMSQEEDRIGLDGGRIVVRKEPVGVVGVITPWNAPAMIACFSVPAALLAGCTVVLKPAPESPLHAQVLAQVFDEAGFPPGVFNVLTTGLEGSQALVEHPEIDKIIFTGSTNTGRRIGESCGRQIKRCCLELGGKSAAIVLDDAKLDAVIPFLTFTAYMNNGEACVGQTRIVVPRHLHDEIVGRMSDVVKHYKVGSPFDTDTVIGPLITEKQRAIGEAYVQAGLDDGATLALGGDRPKSLLKGWYLNPTLFANVDMSMRVAREEIFCPVVCVLPYDSVDEAIEIANDSDYGLSGSVWTSNPDLGLDIARHIETGNIGINTFNLDFNAPFGGMKRSGIGRQLGPEGLDTFFETKAIHFPLT